MERPGGTERRVGQGQPVRAGHRHRPQQHRAHRLVRLQANPTNPLVTTGHSGDLGISDVYYTSSSDHGSTWAPAIRVNDRGIDRSKGVWSNNIDSKFNVGVAATNDNVFFAWQDTRNALGETGSEDIYTSSVPLTPVTVAESDSGIPGWTLLLTGLFGLGLGVAVAWLLFRRQSSAGSAPQGTPARA